MKIVTDLHIHSRCSRACSKHLELPNIAQWCQYKGIDLVATGDFTHPAWNKVINESLEETTDGIYKLKNSANPTRFILGTELCFMYKKNDKGRRQHLCVFAPNIDVMNKITASLLDWNQGKKSNLFSDGRPILSFSCKEFLERVLEIDERIYIIPAHAWTPWFSIFGSKSGFDSLQECFDDLSEYIFAIETGLSSDPPMNWLVSALDNITLISNSDAHSLENLGRNANVFDLPQNYTYNDIFNILKNPSTDNFLYTIEFYPEEGKYHMDGHAECKVCLHPKESLQNNNLCPKCKKPLTLGVWHRVYDLADRQEPNRPGAIPFKRIVPLQELISNALGRGKKTKTVMNEYMHIIGNCTGEFNVLLDYEVDKLRKIAHPRVVEAILKVRADKVYIEAGYDGVFGKVLPFGKGDEPTLQRKLL